MSTASGYQVKNEMNLGPFCSDTESVCLSPFFKAQPLLIMPKSCCNHKMATQVYAAVYVIQKLH